MLNPRHVVVALLIAATGIAVPAAQADNAENAGRRCGFASNNDTTGVIQQNENVQFGAIRSATWAAADVVDDDSPGGTHGALAEITVHCWIQVNAVTPAHAPIETAHCDFEGTGVAPGGVCQITYLAGITDNVYLCTYVAMEHSGHLDEYWEDEFPDQPGVQCPLAISASTPPSSEVGCTASGNHNGGTASVTLTCAGDGHDRGTYSLTISFSGGCGGASGTGTITGTSDGNSISGGTHSYSQAGGAWVVDGTFNAEGHAHQVRLTLATTSCPGAITGGGVVTSGV